MTGEMTVQITGDEPIAGDVRRRYVADGLSGRAGLCDGVEAVVAKWRLLPGQVVGCEEPLPRTESDQVHRRFLAGDTGSRGPFLARRRGVVKAVRR